MCICASYGEMWKSNSDDMFDCVCMFGLAYLFRPNWCRSIVRVWKSPQSFEDVINLLRATDSAAGEGLQKKNWTRFTEERDEL